MVLDIPGIEGCQYLQIVASLLIPGEGLEFIG
jgi:hypothetical protein